jgi:hypothetical protein
MDRIRDLLKICLGQSLGSLCEEDRVAASWPLACGKALADRGTIVGYERGVVRVQVEDRVWLRQLMSIQGHLASEMTRIAGVYVSEIHFEMKRY